MPPCVTDSTAGRLLLLLPLLPLAALLLPQTRCKPRTRTASSCCLPLLPAAGAAGGMVPRDAPVSGESSSMAPLRRATASTALAVSSTPPALPRAMQSMACCLSGSPLERENWQGGQQGGAQQPWQSQHLKVQTMLCAHPVEARAQSYQVAATAAVPSCVPSAVWTTAGRRRQAAAAAAVSGLGGMHGGDGGLGELQCRCSITFQLPQLVCVQQAHGR